jgi:hypothetical protein
MSDIPTRYDRPPPIPPVTHKLPLGPWLPKGDGADAGVTTDEGAPAPVTDTERSRVDLILGAIFLGLAIVAARGIARSARPRKPGRCLGPDVGRVS